MSVVAKKTAETWTASGYLFHCFGRCDACMSPVEFWWAPRTQSLQEADASATMEAHYATCAEAKEFRQIQKEVTA